MKKFYYILSIALCSLQVVYSQNGWFWQNPLPQGNHLHQIQFVGNNIYIAVGDGGTFMTTTDAGLNWNIKFSIAGYSNNYTKMPLAISSLHFKNSSTGFVAAASDGNNSKILRTTDSGSSWDTVMSNIWPLTFIFFVNDDVGFCFSGKFDLGAGNVLKTTNGGMNWYIVNNALNSISSCYFTDSNTGWAVGWYSSSFYSTSYVYKTIDGGVNWSNQLTGTGFPTRSVFFLNENTGWVGSTKIWKTTNSGISWISQNISANAVLFINISTGYCVNNNSFYKSTDSGENWTTCGNISGNSLSSFNSNEIFVVGNYGAISRSTDGGSNWSNLSQILVNENLWSIVFPNVNTGYVTWSGSNSMYPSGGIIKTTDRGLHWNIIHYDTTHFLYKLVFVNNNTGWVSGSNILKKTTDGGSSWNIQNLGLTGSLDGICFLNSNTGWVAIETNGLNFLKTTNGGMNWINIYSWNYALAGTTKMHFLNELNGVIIGSTGRLLTSNGGTNWQFYSNNYTIQGSSRDTMGNLYACSFSQVYKSTDFGLSWFLISNPFVSSAVTEIQMANSNTGYLAGLHGSVLKTTNGGVDWIKQNSLTANQIRSIFPLDTNCWLVGDKGLILSTVGKGVINGLEVMNNESPTNFSLHQNYPNPFNPTTKIRFDIPSVGQRHAFDVRLVIYDLLGREVATLVNKQLQPGTYEVGWDGSAFASGVYFYKLITYEYAESRKMILIK